MALLFISKNDSPSDWQEALASLEPELEFKIWPDLGKPSEIEVALVWNHPAGALGLLPNLKLIQSLGAGIDHVLTDPRLPKNVPIARLVDTELTRQMVEYVVLAVLNRHRRIDELRRAQFSGDWQVIQPVPIGRSRVGLLGFGHMGQAASNALVNLGFNVTVWTRTPRSAGSLTSYHGSEGFPQVLQTSDILICLLPLTPKTHGLLNAKAFAALPAEAYVINVARGAHLVDEDLLAAIDNGHLSGAWLDVFDEEPLPPDHSFWAHPQIVMTPHLAALTVASSAATQVINNLRLVRTGKPPQNLVNPEIGY